MEVYAAMIFSMDRGIGRIVKSVEAASQLPAGIPTARAGQLVRQPSHLIDIMATAIDVSGAPYPEEVDGHRILPPEGVSLRPAFSSQDIARSAPLFWEHRGNRALRQGDWKIVARGTRGAWELYNLKQDRTELNNLAGQHPERVAAMAGEWKKQAHRTHILPWPHGPAPE